MWVAIILVVVIVIIGGVLLMGGDKKKKGTKARETEGEASTVSSEMETSISAIIEKSCGIKLGLNFLNDMNRKKFDQLMAKQGKACIGPGRLARRYTKYLDKRGRCYTQADCAAA